MGNTGLALKSVSVIMRGEVAMTEALTTIIIQEEVGVGLH
jgi:hypothetical protein